MGVSDFFYNFAKKIYKNTDFSFLRCRCTERLVPGCTRKFCNLEQSTKTPQLIQTPVNQGSASDTRNNNNNKGAGVVNFPGASSGALTREDKKVCLDSEGNERSEGDSWKNACNTCRCGPNGLAFCTQIFCAAIFAEDTKGNINIHTSK